MKKCPKCEETKPLDDFHRSSAKPDGRVPNCKKCVSEYAKEYRTENAEHRSKMGKDYYERQKGYKKAQTAERIARYKEEYERLDITTVTKACSKCDEVKTLEFFSPRATARDGRRADCKACGAAQKTRKREELGDEYKEYKKEYNKEYRRKNGEKLNENNRQWRKDNPHYETDRRANDPLYRIRKNVSCAVYAALAARRTSKDGQSTFAHLPYTTQQLREHIESQFEDWMTWDNWGMIGGDERTWNIDHIYPHSKFQYETLEDEAFKLCWSLNNLRPLDAEENVSKRDNVVVEFEDVFGCEKPEKVA